MESKYKNLLLKQVQKIGVTSQTFEVFKMKVVLESLKGKQSLAVVRSAARTSSDEAKNKEYEYSLISYSLKELHIPKDDESGYDIVKFEDQREAYVFISQCQTVLVDELLACYTEMIDNQQSSLSDEYGELNVTRMSKKYFNEKLKQLTEDEPDDDTSETLVSDTDKKTQEEEIVEEEIQQAPSKKNKLSLDDE